MKAKNIEAASKIVTESQILINMVSRRVRQLNAGSRPLIDVEPGEGFADIALQEIARQMPSLTAATQRFGQRLAALRARGIDTASLPFDAGYGRNSMEYYDGFVFAFLGAPDLPPYASGGRYDALTQVLGGGRSIPAVGGVIRPHLVAALRGAA